MLTNTLPLHPPAAADLVARSDDRSNPVAPAIEPLLVDADHASRMCGVSTATWFRLKSAGKTPAPVKLGGRVLYRLSDLRLWAELGCPDRRTFEARKPAGSRRM